MMESLRSLTSTGSKSKIPHFDASSRLFNSTSTVKARKSSSVNSNLGSLSLTSKKTKRQQSLFHTPKPTRPSLYTSAFSTASKTGRPSFGGSNDDRQKDTRHLTDLCYQNDVSTKIIKFLTSNGYQAHIPLNTKFLRNPTRQHVGKIFEFLFAQLYDGYRLEFNAIENVVPEVMSNVGYPFKINKSMLQSFAGQKNIGILHGILDWLVDFIVYIQNFNPEECRPSPLDEREEVAIKARLLDAVFNGEDTDDLLNSILIEKYGTREIIMDYDRQSNKLLDVLRTKEAEERKIDKITEAFELKSYDTESLKEFQENVVGAISREEEIAEDLKKDIEELLSEEQKLNRRGHELDELIAQQDVDRAEIEAALKRQQILDTELKNEEKKIKQLKQEHCETQSQSKDLEYELSKLASDYMTYLGSLTSIFDVPNKKEINKLLLSNLGRPEWKIMFDYLSKLSNGNIEADYEIMETFNDLINKQKDILSEAYNQVEEKITFYEKKILNEKKQIEEENLLFQKAQDDLEIMEKELEEFKMKSEFEIRQLNARYNELIEESESSSRANESSDFSAQINELQEKIKDELEGNRLEETSWEDEIASIFESEKKAWVQLSDSTTEFLSAQRRQIDNLKAEVAAEKIVAHRMMRKIESKKLKIKMDFNKDVEMSETPKIESLEPTDEAKEHKENIDPALNGNETFDRLIKDHLAEIIETVEKMESSTV